jgi:hypothetical protein
MRAVPVVIGLVFCLGCTNARNTIIPQDISKLDTIKPSVDKLTSEEKGLFVTYMMRHTVGAALGSAFGVKQEAIPASMTIGKAIEEQKAFAVKMDAEAAAKKAAGQKAEADRKALADQLAQVLTANLREVSLHKATFQNFDVENYIKFGISFENKGAKSIVGIKGIATFRDKFGDVISTLPMKIEVQLKPGQTTLVKLQKKYNQFDSDDQKLANVYAATAKFELTPEVVLFSDGSKFEAPKAPE